MNPFALVSSMDVWAHLYSKTHNSRVYNALKGALSRLWACFSPAHGSFSGSLHNDWMIIHKWCINISYKCILYLICWFWPLPGRLSCMASYMVLWGLLNVALRYHGDIVALNEEKMTPMYAWWIVPPCEETNSAMYEWLSNCATYW